MSLVHEAIQGGGYGVFSGLKSEEARADEGKRQKGRACAAPTGCRWAHSRTAPRSAAFMPQKASCESSAPVNPRGFMATHLAAA